VLGVEVEVDASTRDVVQVLKNEHGKGEFDCAVSVAGAGRMER